MRVLCVDLPPALVAELLSHGAEVTTPEILSLERLILSPLYFSPGYILSSLLTTVSFVLTVPFISILPVDVFLSYLGMLSVCPTRIFASVLLRVAMEPEP